MKPGWLNDPVVQPDKTKTDIARERQQQLTKPSGSLGRLESLAIRLAALQGREFPRVESVRVTVFAGDHGVVESGISAYPQTVTVQMIANFCAGGAAISVLSRFLGLNWR